MELKRLLGSISYEVVQGNLDIEVTGVSWDSRRVKPGSVFICVKGRNVDRHNFAKQAVEDGAQALIVEQQVFRIPKAITVIRVEDTKLALAEAASILYDNPSEKFKLIGVTGTNGKTSVTYFIESILQSAGYKPGIIGTIENRIGDKKLETVKVNPTTPDPLELQSSFNEMYLNGATHVVMEVTSSALAQKRVHGCSFDIGVFTNLTQDHLEEHGTMENYKKEKLKLFSLCKQGIINIDDPSSKDFIEASECPILTYGIEKKAEVMAEEVHCSREGIDFILRYKEQCQKFSLKLLGRFNVYNVLAAAAACLQCGLDFEEVKRGVQNLRSVKGRFEVIQTQRGYSVVIDYAHSPDSLKNILCAVRELGCNRIILVFGCGGDRDKSKRPIMGNIACSLSDYFIITSDNPRKEEPNIIIEDIERGIIRKGCKYEKIVDRRRAIIKALNMAKPDDVVVIAGKGHENYQIIGDKYAYFDDAEVVREYLDTTAK